MIPKFLQNFDHLISYFINEYRHQIFTQNGQ